MNWLNLNVAILDSENFIGSDPIDRATWICLLRYCAGQENGGTITECGEWPDRKWQQLVRVTRQEVERECALWDWDNGSLVVWGYPADKEREIIAKRNAGREGGKVTSEAKTKAVKENGKKGGRPKTEASDEAEPKQEPKQKPKGMEGKGIGIEVPPLPPKGDGAGGHKPHVLPDGWSRMTKTEQKQTRVNINSPMMNRIGRMLGRRDGTLWTVAEAVALKTTSPTLEEVESMEKYYLAIIPRDEDFRRRDLITLLNNWNGELDRARIFSAA